MVNQIEELGSISEHGNFSDSTKVDTRTEEDDDTDVEEVRAWSSIMTHDGVMVMTILRENMYMY